MRNHPHKDEKYRIHKLPKEDRSPRCKRSGICDGNHECGPDGLGCVTKAEDRKAKVQEAARWTWKGYRQYAWGHDELNAGSRNNREWFNMGLTIVDSLDTLIILGLMEEYTEARYWVANHLDLNQGSVSVFEVTIRILGGFAAAYYHSGGDELYLQKAVEFAERLLPAFNTSTGINQPHFNIHDKDVANYRASVGSTCLAEVGTLSMEFSAVTRLSGRPEFRDTAMVFWKQLRNMHNTDGLYCTMLAGDNLGCNGNHYTFGASADSAYEYMLKQWILTGGKDTHCLEFYKRALFGLRKHMLTELWMGNDIGDVWIAAESEGGYSKSLVLEHLTCFLPGTMALGHMYGVNSATKSDEDDDLMVAVKLMKACYELYHQTPTGVAWDSVYLQPHNDPPPPPPASSPPPRDEQQRSEQQQAGSGSGSAGDGASGASSRHLLGEEGKQKYIFRPRSVENFLRPEVAESLFYLWRATGDPIYREWGWNMFRAYERWCRVKSGGYQVLNNVEQVPPITGDKMESFWIAETLKYFYLLFSDDPNEIPFDEFVFNTEAHPLAIWGTKTDVKLRQRLLEFHQNIGDGGGMLLLEQLQKMRRMQRRR